MGMELKELLKVDSYLKPISIKESQTITGLTTLDSPKKEHLSFISNKKFFEKFKESNSKDMFLCVDEKFFGNLNDEDKKYIEENSEGLLLTENFPLTLCHISKAFYSHYIIPDRDIVDGRKTGTALIDPMADIAENVFIGDNVKIGDGSVIYSGVTILSGSTVGKNSVIYPNVTIGHNVHIADNVRIHSNSTIGADGFGYNFDQGVHHKIWHMGGVEIQSNVEIGSNTCIDQGTFSPTVIGDGSKIDNQVQIAHNVRLGRGVIICGQCAIAGSTSVGDYTVMGGKAALTNDITVGSACQIAGAAMVTGSLEDGAKVAGHPARPLKEWLKGVAYIRKNSLSK